MRRSDREKSKEFGFDLIDRVNFGVMSIYNTNYSIPLTFVRDDNKLYFHAAKSGMKNDLLRDNDIVRIVFVDQNYLPERISDDQINKDPKNLEKLFTLKYSSAIVKGKCSLIKDQKTKEKSLDLICKKFYPNDDIYIKQAINMNAKYTDCYEITITNIEAKSNI